MVFGFGKKKSEDYDDDDEDEDEEDDRDLVNFQGAVNGKAADMAANARLAQAALIPTKELITDAIERRAEMVRLDVKGERAQTAIAIDGMPYAGTKMPKQQAVAITQMVKLLAGLDAKLKGKHQVGGVKAEFGGTKYEVSVDVQPVPDGSERLTLRIRNLKQKLDTPMDLGMPDTLRAKIRELTSTRHGLILVAGPAGSGTTTTAYAVVRGIDMYIYSVYSLNPPGTRELINVKQFEENEADDYSATCARIMREEADVIFAPTLKDAETANHFLNVCDRICVIAETPAKDAATAICQIAEWSGNRELASQNIDAAFSQKMVRLLCKDCREAFRPNPKLLEKVGLPPETKTLYRKGEPMVDEKTGEEDPPCEKCDGIGYMGRVAMFEVIVATDAIRKMIAEGAPADQIKAVARSESGGVSFHKDGLRLVAEGKTSLEELQRVFKG